MIKFILKGIIKDFTQYILATIGLIIGITSLVSMGYLGIAGKIKLYKEIEKQGINIIYVYPEYSKKYPFRKNISGKYPALKDRELLYIKNTVFYLDKAVPAKFTTKNVKYGNNIINNVEIIGTNKDYLDILNYKIFYGNPFNDCNGCYIGYTIFKEIFNEDFSIIGKNINIGNKFLKINGILSQKGVSSSGRDKDKIIIIPLKFFTEKFKNTDFYDVIYITPISINFINDVKKNIIFLLKLIKNNFILPKPVQFTTRTMQYYINKQNKIGKLMVLSTFIVSCITLIVGGIGVMAVMIILSIKEKKDIGIKRAIGATKLDIFIEYMLKSLSIAFCSSLFGVGLSCISYIIINKIYGIAGQFPLTYTVIGIVSAFLISIFFGLYPAYKASKIAPWTALRYQ